MGVSNWRRQGRAMARALGAERTAVGAVNDQGYRLPGWVLRIKTRATIPAWLWVALDQATREAEMGEYPAVVLAHVSQGKKARRLVILDFAHFRALVSDIERERGDEEAQGDAP